MLEPVKSDKILLVEDDQNLGYLLSERLLERGYDVSWKKNGKDALTIFEEFSFTLCLVDIIVPGIDGIELVKRIKKLKPSTPIIFITARALKSDVMAGYDAGCDDYITKPFEVYELLLKVKAMIARASGRLTHEERFYRMGNLELDAETQRLLWADKETKVNRTESQLLKLLLSSGGEVVTRNFLLETIWGRNDIYTSKSLDTYLSKVRKYLKGTNLELINIYGLGYQIKCSE